MNNGFEALQTAMADDIEPCWALVVTRVVFVCSLAASGC